ncbi:MAG: hypothetical protein IAE78_22905 [Myxococcus sp.]|nr:hypothetical protein [Myxococcus sp.]
MRRLRLLFIQALLLGASVARAHDADVVYARLEPGAAGSLNEIVTLTTPTLGLLAPVDVDGDGAVTQAELDERAAAVNAGVWDDLPLTAGRAPCIRSDETARLEDGFVTLTARWRCPEGDLRQDFKVLRVLPTNYRVVLGSQLDGERGRRFAQGVFTALEVPRPGPPALLDATRLLRGLELGVRDNGVVEALALLLLCFLTSGGLRGGALRLGLLLLGAQATWSGASAPLAVAALLGASAALLLFAPERRGGWAPVAAALAGVGLALRGGLPGFSDRLGWVLGLTLVGGALLLVGAPLGRLLARRPRPFLVVKLILGALVLFSVGLRLG